MLYDMSKNIELYLLKADNFDEKIAPHQKQYYLDVAKWMSENEFESPEDSMERIKSTPYYEGGGIAKMADDIDLRIRAMEEIGYDDVAKMHEERRKKFEDRGNAYAFSQEWIDDLNEVQKVMEQYLRRKEVFGRIFSGYFQAFGNPQQEHRETAVKGILKGLEDLENLGVTFDELAGQKAYRKLTMTTDEGMDNFIDYVQKIKESGQMPEDVAMSEHDEERKRIENWAKSHEKELVEAGKKEKWHRANCIAVPSDDPLGYEYIAMKEVGK